MITTDQEREFNNKNLMNEDLMRTFNIDHRLTTPYNPQANGLDERFNQTLSNSLSKYAQENKECWDEDLQHVVYCMLTILLYGLALFF